MTRLLATRKMVLKNNFLNLNISLSVSMLAFKERAGTERWVTGVNS